MKTTSFTLGFTRYLVESEDRPSDEMFIFGLTRLLEGIAAYAVTSSGQRFTLASKAYTSL